jgi:hypothetical protein
MRKRALTIIAMASLLPVGFAIPASADIPDGTVLPGGPNGPVCQFSILVQDVKNNRNATTTKLPDGSTVTRTTGQLIQRLTNETTGKSIVVDVSGPTTETAKDDTTTFEGTGRNLLAFGPGGQHNTGEPGAVVTSGNVKVTVKGNTAQTFKLNGHQDNICQLLGP